MTPNAAVRKGLQKIGVKASGESVDGDESVDGIELLNQMLHSWELVGVDLKHYDATSGNEIPLPQNHDIAIIYNFAVFAAPEYEVSASPEVVGIAISSMQALRNAYLDPNAKLEVDKTLLPYYNANYRL